MANCKKDEPRNPFDALNDLFATMAAIAEEAEQEEKEAKMAEQKAQYDESAESLFMVYVSFIEAGFNEKQAFDLLLTIVSGGVRRA